MPLEKRSFMGGMNKDGDVRLIKNPDYIDALNVRAATSVDGTVGSLENIEGNIEVPFEFYSTAPETFFVNDNGLYEEINAATVFYQKVIRIQGWEQTNTSYNFSLFSVGPNGNVFVGEFNWTGNTGHTFTSFYLNSQFSSAGPFNTGINVYDINTGEQYTASVKLLSFGQNTMLHGGYFDVVIECDVAGVNFDLSVSSNVDSDNLIYTYSEEQNGIPITANENLSIFLLPGFDTGGVYNTDANDDGVTISPSGTLYEVGNRTVWRIVISGQQPTSSPASFDEIAIFSYRENLNPANQNEDYEFLPFLTIDAGTFSSGDYEFDSNQNSLSAFFHNEFSESKNVLCDGLPLTFTIPAESFFLTFSENATFDGTNDFSIIIVGPVGVKFKLALADSSESLNSAFATGNIVLGNQTADFSTIFNNGSVITLNNYQIVENSIEITDSIVNSYDALQSELEYQIQIYGQLEQISVQLNAENNNLEQQLTDQIALTATANQELADTEANLALANQGLANANSTIASLGQANDYLQEQNDQMLVSIATINSELEEVSDQLNFTQAQLNIAQGDLADEQSLTSDQELTIATLNAEIVSLGEAIVAINVAHGGELAALQAELGGEIEELETVNENLETLLESTNAMIVQYLQDMADQDDDHANLVAEMGVTHQAQIDQLIADHNQALQDAEDADQAAQDALYSDFEAQLENLTNTHISEVNSLNNDITQLSTQVSDQTEMLENLQANYTAMVADLEALQALLDEGRISDAIIIAKLNEYNEFYNSINASYNSSLLLFNTLSLSNQIIYEEDFSSSSDFTNEWLLYTNLFSDGINSLSFYDETGIINPSGYENNGYLKLPISTDDADGYTAVRLPYSSFQTSAGWQHGSEVAIQMAFEVVNTGNQYQSLPSGLSIDITNQWDDTDLFDTNAEYGFWIPYTLTLAGGQNNNLNFSHSFTVNDPDNNFINEYSNVTIIIPPVPDNVEIRLTNIRIGNDSQEMFSFELNNQVPISEESYLEIYNIAQTTVLNWQSSDFDSIEEYLESVNSSSFYQDLLSITIAGYGTVGFGAFANSTIGGRLQSYAEAVFDFSSSVQQQIYNQYVLYALASTVDISSLQALQEQHQQHVDLLNGQINAQAAEIESLEFQLDNAIDTISSQSGAFLPTLNDLLLGENIVSAVYNVLGPEPGAVSEWIIPPQLWLGGNEGLTIKPVWVIGGVNFEGDPITIMTNSELVALVNQPLTSTNNFLYYLKNRFDNNQAIDTEIPGGGYPTQVMHVLYGNFNEETANVVNNDLNPAISASVDWTSSAYYNCENLEDYLTRSMVQLVFYFNVAEADNVTFTEELYLKRWNSGYNGMLWYGESDLGAFHAAIPKIETIRYSPFI